MNEPLTLWSDSREHRAGWYPARTLTAKVPATRHSDFWPSESLAILEYLEEAFPPRHPRYGHDIPADIACADAVWGRPQVQSWAAIERPPR
jgi:glutathione S-transferase